MIDDDDDDDDGGGFRSARQTFKLLKLIINLNGSDLIVKKRLIIEKCWVII